MGQSARVFALAAAVAFGAVAAERFRPSVPIALGGAGLFVVLAVWRRTTPVLLAAALALGAGLAGARIESVDRAALAHGARAGADALLEGEALTDGRRDGDAVRLVLGVARAEVDGTPYALRERAWLTIRPPPETPIRAGELLRVDTKLRPVLLPDMDDAGKAAATRLRRRGVAARAFARGDAIERLGRRAHPLSVIADAGREAVRRVADRVPAREQGLLLGVTIGDTSRLDPQTDIDFRATGLTHLLAVSGANVAMVLAVVAVALRALRVGRRMTVALLAVATLSFMAITRFEPSVLRAGAMALIALGGVTVGARRQALNVLAVATLGLLVYDPFLAFEVGFQLSVLATLGILAIAPKVAERLPRGPLGTAAAVTLGAQLAVVPLIVLHFKQLSLISLAANVVVAPAVAPATVLGMVAGAGGAVWEPLGVLARAAQPFLAWMAWVAHALAALPLATVDTPAGPLGLLISAALTAAALAAARGTGRARRAAPLVLSLALIATGGVWARALGPPPLGGLVVTMLDVGQGEAVVVRSDGRAMLVDGGPDERVVLKGLRAEGVHRIDLLVASHPHADHVDGLAAVAQTVPVARALDPMIDNHLPSHEALLETLGARGVPVDRASAGMTYRLGRAEVDVLWPPDERMQGTEEDTNNNSIVLRVRFGRQVVLLAGETQEEAQQALLDADPEALRADVLKVSHHGSRRMVPAFYQATGARLALIPVGPNTYGHPAAETLIALRDMTVLRSDDHGTVSVALDGAGGIQTRTARGAIEPLDNGQGEREDGTDQGRQGSGRAVPPQPGGRSRRRRLEALEGLPG